MFSLISVRLISVIVSVKIFLLIFVLAALAAKIDLALDSSNIGTSKVEEIAARNIRTLLVKSVSPVLKSVRDPPDNIEEFKTLYGSLGPYLQQGVVSEGLIVRS